MDSTNIVTPTVTAVPRNERTMYGEDFFFSDSEFVRPSIPPFFRFLSKLSFQRQPDSFQRGPHQKGSVAILFVLEIILSFQKLCVSLTKVGMSSFYSGFVPTVELYF